MCIKAATLNEIIQARMDRFCLLPFHEEPTMVKIPRAEAGWWLGKEESGVVVNNRAGIWEVRGLGRWVVATVPQHCESISVIL